MCIFFKLPKFLHLGALRPVPEPLVRTYTTGNCRFHDRSLRQFFSASSRTQDEYLILVFYDFGKKKWAEMAFFKVNYSSFYHLRQLIVNMTISSILQERHYRVGCHQCPRRYHQFFLSYTSQLIVADTRGIHTCFV